MSNPTKEEILEVSKKKNVGLIYSVSDLNNYFVEVLSSGENHMIKKKNELLLFVNLKEACYRAETEGCSEIYMCLDNTYDECGVNGEIGERYSYMPLHKAG